MRTLTLFALALFGTAVLTDDASAIGKRKRGGSSSASSCDCGGSAGGYSSSGMYPGGVGYAPGATNGLGTTIQATDGQFYTLGADGTYYAASSMTTRGGFASQPYTSGYSPSTYYPGTYRGMNPYQNVYPAGYPGGPGYVYPAGGTPPLAMPMPRR